MTETTPIAAEAETAPVQTEPADPAAMTADDLAAIRALALKAHPDVVPELVGGATVAELMASLEPARAAYGRIVAAAPAAPTTVPVVPAGDAPRLTVDPDLLPAAEKIRRGLQAKSAVGSRQ